MSEGVRGVVVGHSTLGEGLVAAVRKITGVGEEALCALSNEGQGPDGLVEAIRGRAGEDPVLLFTDMAGGSCAFAARKLAGQRGAVAHRAGGAAGPIGTCRDHGDVYGGDGACRSHCSALTSG